MATIDEELLGGKEKDIYFLISYQRREEEKIDELIISKYSIMPTNIYTNEIKGENGIYYFNKVFKFKNIIQDNPVDISTEIGIGNDNYKVSFDIKEYSFIFDVELKKRRDITEEIIDQNNIDYFSKLNIFIEALKKNNEEDKTNELYKESIEMYSEKKSFIFLISLFVQIYKNKELCPILMEKFKEMNNKTKDNEKNNMDRNKELEKYIDNIKDISSEADNLINCNDYDPIEFYGIILCYLYYYDNMNFQKIFGKLFVEKCYISYEILLIYSSHFLNQIEQNLYFFVDFIYYSITKKDYNNFIIGLNYIRDIESFIVVIEKTKQDIFDKYITSNESFQPIKLKDNLEIIKRHKNKEIEVIIHGIRSIINYSKEKKNIISIFYKLFLDKIIERI